MLWQILAQLPPWGWTELVTVCGGVLTVWAVISKIVNPVRKMLEHYDSALKSSTAKLAEMDLLIDGHKAEIEESKKERGQLRRAVQALTRYTMYSECLRAIQKGHRSNGAAKDLEPVYQSYVELGQNGLGAKIYRDYLDLPVEDQ